MIPELGRNYSEPAAARKDRLTWARRQLGKWAECRLFGTTGFARLFACVYWNTGVRRFIMVTTKSWQEVVRWIIVFRDAPHFVAGQVSPLLPL